LLFITIFALSKIKTMLITSTQVGNTLINLEQASQITGLTRAGLRPYMENGELPFHPVGKYNLFIREEVQAFSISRADKKAAKAKARTRKPSSLKAGDVELKEIDLKQFMSVWEAGARCGIDQSALADRLKANGVLVYNSQGGRYIMRREFDLIDSLL
jgi:hypothetical protein